MFVLMCRNAQMLIKYENKHCIFLTKSREYHVFYTEFDQLSLFYFQRQIIIIQWREMLAYFIWLDFNFH